MRVLLAGSRSFGHAAYEMLRGEEHEIAAVWSPWDRTDKLTQRASADGLWWHPGERLPELVKAEGVDLIIAAHSHDFISTKTRQATRLGGLGYHPSLLPRHRGRDAVRWTIHMEDPIAGGTAYWLTDNIDGGPIYLQEHTHVPPSWRSAASGIDGASMLWRERLFPMGIDLLRRALRGVEEGTLVEIPQDELCATWEPSWERPPLHRPDLTQIGGIPGYTHVVR